MSERNVEVIRSEIAAERQRLDDDLKALQAEMRSIALFVAAGLVVVGVVTWRKSVKKGVEAIFKVAR
jgi:hypothetical protein